MKLNFMLIAVITLTDSSRSSNEIKKTAQKRREKLFRPHNIKSLAAALLFFNVSYFLDDALLITKSHSSGVNR